MKIIREGVVPKKKHTLYRGECLYCKCMIEVNENDVSGQDDYYYYRCPTTGCGKTISVYEYVTR